MAMDMLDKQQQGKLAASNALQAVKQTNFDDIKSIVQGGRATGHYSSVLPQDHSSSGLGSALQAIGGTMGSGGSDSPDSPDAPSTNLEKPGLLSDWAPSLIKMSVKDAPSDLDEALDHGPLSLGSMDPTPEKLTDDPDATSGFNDTLADKLAQKHYGMGKGRFGI